MALLVELAEDFQSATVDCLMSVPLVQLKCIVGDGRQGQIAQLLVELATP